ncbi:MAG: hypothetical protein IIZ63_12570 [Caulobacteraceae bacterium]|nr:hypothetical protein [Caulobacteraceae bacterium]
MMERVGSWTLALTLVALLLFEAWQVFFWLNPNPVFGLIAARSGVGLFEPVMRYVTGAAEVVAAALLLYPRTRSRGAMLALLIVVGALAMHLSPWLGVQVPDLTRTSAALAQGKTAMEIAAMNLPTDKGAMFLLALAIGLISVGSIAMERAKVRALAPKPKRPAGAFA